MELKKFNSPGKIVVIYEQNEVGAGNGLYIVDTNDFDKSIEEENTYLKAIEQAILEEDKWGYGGNGCIIMLHNILDGDYGQTKVKEIKPPCKIDKAVYIFCH